jgi:hypothetical protein
VRPTAGRPCPRAETVRAAHSSACGRRPADHVPELRRCARPSRGRETQKHIPGRAGRADAQPRRTRGRRSKRGRRRSHLHHGRGVGPAGGMGQAGPECHGATGTSNRPTAEPPGWAGSLGLPWCPALWPCGSRLRDPGRGVGPVQPQSTTITSAATTTTTRPPTMMAASRRRARRLAARSPSARSRATICSRSA